jgi:hypothetical protein
VLFSSIRGTVQYCSESGRNGRRKAPILRAELNEPFPLRTIVIDLSP